LPGSVFHKDEDKEAAIIGKIVDLKPADLDVEIAHHIWRNGKAIMLPIVLK